jgi:1,4-dihydroxy-2-naphthoate octaprenyltransferase
MKPLRIWILAARPKTLIASVSPVVIGTALALKEGFFHPITFFCTLFAALCVQIGTNFANDYFDFLKGADTSQRKGPLRVTQSGLVSLKAMRRAIAIIFLIAILFSIPLIWKGGVPFAALLSLYILLGIIYTAGPFSLAYLGLGDLFVLFLYGPVAVFFTFYLQTSLFSLKAFIAGVAPGALSTAIILMNNLRDVEEDLLAKKQTTIVRFGKTFGKVEYLSVLLLAAITPFWIGPAWLGAADLSLIVALPLITANFSKKSHEVFDQGLKKQALILVLYTLLFSLLIVL